MVFLDQRAAFPSVARNIMFWVLEQMQLPAFVVRAIKMLLVLNLGPGRLAPASCEVEQPESSSCTCQWMWPSTSSVRMAAQFVHMLASSEGRTAWFVLQRQLPWPRKCSVNPLLKSLELGRAKNAKPTLLCLTSVHSYLLPYKSL